MKKSITALCAGLMLLSLTGCSKHASYEPSSQPESSSQSYSTESNDQTPKSDTDTDSVATTGSDDESGATNSDTTKTTQSSSDAKVTTPSSDTQAPKTKDTVHSESGAKTDISKARITLYTAGIDSSSIDDATLKKMWTNAKGDTDEFVKAVKAHLE